MLKLDHFDFKVWIVDLLFDHFGNEFNIETLARLFGIVSISYIPEFHFASKGLGECCNWLNSSISAETFLFKTFELRTKATDLMRINFL